jgi:hypothetical protein
MNGKKILLVGLLVIGLAVLGTGVGLLVSRPESNKVPDEKPVISSEAKYANNGERERLFIYNDGSVIFIKGDNSQKWQTGKLSSSELTGILNLVGKPEFAALASQYQFLGDNTTDGKPRVGDLDYVIAVNHNSLQKSVSFVDYYSPDQKTVYPDLPYPAADIYQKLKEVVASTVK